jgi:hypothetical protein
MTTDFAGLNGFVWFTGVVEDRQDPLKLGRVRVRIIGWHDFDENLIPTDSLPWAQILHSSVGPRTFTSIKEGEWVSGYFLDGANAQEPVIMGVYPGIVSEQSIIVVNKNKQSPKLPLGLKADVIGEPTLPPMAREKIEGTAINVSNNTQAHICDITNDLKKDVAVSRIKFSQLMNKIRAFIQELIAKLGLDPSGEISKLISLAKGLLNKLKYFRDILLEILDFREVLIEYARRVKAMIDYILSLPAKLAKLLSDCLRSFLGAIASIFSELISVPGLDGINENQDIVELFDTIEDIVSTSQETVQAGIEVITIPVSLVSTLTVPSTQREADDAGSSLISYISETIPSSNEVIQTNLYSSASARQP